MNEETTQVLVRVPLRINAELEAEAKRERRSKNAQVVHILEERYRAEPESSAARGAA